MSHPAQATSAFNTTRWTWVAQLRDSEDELEKDRILADLCRDYWFPLYGYARRAGRSPEDAEDLTQSFFEHALRSQLFAKAQPTRGRLRTFLLSSFQNHLHGEYIHRTAAKRGGREKPQSFDAMAAEERYRAEPAEITTPEELYNRRWARDFFLHVQETLKQEYLHQGKRATFEALQPWLFIEGRATEYEPRATALGTTEGNFRVLLSRFRKRYRDLFRRAVADTLDSPSEAQIEQEIRELIRLGTR